MPKAEELVATPYRHGSKEKAETFFLDGMTQAMHRLAEQAHPAFPVTIYYAFKQAESDGGDGTTNTGWDTFLAAVIEAGFAISGTWPMRTELSNRMIGSGTNALASSIVLVCRQRSADAPTATRREFVAALKAELPQALAHLQAGNIAPVDLAQAAIGPGMAVYTRYAKVLDAEGKPLPVRAALALINQTLDEALAEQEGDFDADTRWALTWFEQIGFAEGDYGVAEQLSKSKNTGVDGLVEAGIIVSKAGKVRLLKPAELPADWDPTTDSRLTVWEMVHQLIRVLEAGGESAAAALVAKLGSQAETARELCYRLYTLCERKKRADEAMAYNGLVQSWPEITRLARETPRAGPARHRRPLRSGISTMAITNHERVGKALELLKAGLGPFVEREIKAAIATNALSMEKVKGFVDDPILANKSIGEWDAAALLKLMWETWNEVFRKTLGFAERSLVSEIRDWRNKWAHQEPFSSDDAYRALDSAGRLLSAVSATAGRRGGEDEDGTAARALRRAGAQREAQVVEHRHRKRRDGQPQALARSGDAA